MKNNFEIEIALVNKDFTTNEDTIIRINTELKNNIFLFHTTIPKYIFDYIKDTGDDKYNSSKPGKWDPNKTQHKQFRQKISSHILSDLISQLLIISNDCISIKNFNTAQSDKMIAIKFNHSTHKTKDNFNFSYTGEKFNMNFQFFIVYSYQQKTIMGESVTQYKTRDSIYDVTNKEAYFSNNKNREWYMFNHDISRDFNLIKWSQEAEDFFNNVKKNFNKIAKDLDEYLCDIDDTKMKMLIDNNIKLLGSE